MMPSKQTIPFGLLSSLALLGSVKADGSTSNTSWPEWVTNDCDCVIGCMSGFNDTVTYISQDALAQQAFDCTSSTCKGDVTGNYYQTLYYIQLFYATGSIYEYSDSAPDGYKRANFTDSTGTTSDASASGQSGDDNTIDPTDTCKADFASATDSVKTTGSADAGDGGSTTDTAAVAVDTGTENNGAAVTATESDSIVFGSEPSSTKSATSHTSTSLASFSVAAYISESGAFEVIGGGAGQSVLDAVGALVLGGVW
ncbi:hypothetical protein I314_04850, partial [Cryptococcus bacillisporus CA1873]